MPGPRATERHHKWLDERNLALHRLVAAKLQSDPQLVETALANIERWEAQRGAQPYYQPWKALLATRDLSAILGVLTGEGERERHMRQSSPFAGVLTEDERNAIFEYYETL